MDFEFDLKNITEESADCIKLEDIPAFKFAYSGAMGDAGAIDFLSVGDEIFYHHINYVNGKQEVVDKVFDGFFKPFVDVMNNSALGFMGNLDGWKTYGLGYGNFLYLRNEYVERFERLANAYDENVLNSHAFFYNSVDLLLLMCFNMPKDK